jgi:hypothetical protein
MISLSRELLQFIASLGIYPWLCFLEVSFVTCQVFYSSSSFPVISVCTSSTGTSQVMHPYCELRVRQHRPPVQSHSQQHMVIILNYIPDRFDYSQRQPEQLDSDIEIYSTTARCGNWLSTVIDFRTSSTGSSEDNDQCISLLASISMPSPQVCYSLSLESTCFVSYFIHIRFSYQSGDPVSGLFAWAVRSFYACFSQDSFLLTKSLVSALCCLRVLPHPQAGSVITMVKKSSIRIKLFPLLACHQVRNPRFHTHSIGFFYVRPLQACPGCAKRVKQTNIS